LLIGVERDQRSGVEKREGGERDEVDQESSSRDKERE
jgi:hypothetical protein